MPKEKEPGIHIEEQKSALRIEEVDVEAARCPECAKTRTSSGDPTAYCEKHLKQIYGL